MTILHLPRFPRVTLIAFALLIGHSLLAANEKRSFDIPAGMAERTLRIFTNQCGIQVGFPTEITDGVRTNAVKGNFTPSEAAERLLAGTNLKLVKDERTGAYSVERVTPAKRGNGPQPQSTSRRFSEQASGGDASVTRGSGQMARSETSGEGSITGRVQNAMTGLYLNNARISIRGTERVAFSDQTGTYILPQVPSGEVTLDVFYTGLDAKQVSVLVTSGGVTRIDLALVSAERETTGEVVRLGSIVVKSQREVDGEALASNEQRFAANIKNVVAASSFGDIVEGSVGEFIKYLPGVVVEYVDVNANSVSVRGLGANATGITVDGAPLAQANTTNNRAFEFKQVSINNVSRIEVTKVPTPSDPADSIGGSVNMISRSAFERAQAEFNYSLYMSGNGDRLSLGREPTPHEKRKMLINPGFNFEYVAPFSDRLGVSIAGISANNFSVQNINIRTFNAAGTSTQASFSRPYLQAVNEVDAPKFTRRNSMSIKADWKPSTYSQLSVGIQLGHYVDENMNTNWTANAGTNGVSTITGGVPLSFEGIRTQGATGRGAMSATSFFQYALGVLKAVNGRYRYDDGRWRIEMGASASDSLGSRHQTKHGYFEGLRIALRDPARIEFDMNGPVPIRAYGNNGQEIDLSDINNYVLSSAVSTPRTAIDKVSFLELNARRQIDALPFPAYLQIGGSTRTQKRDSQRDNIIWNYNPPGGANTPAPYLGTIYTRPSPGGLPNVPRVSPDYAWQAFQVNPALFVKTPAQLVAEERFRIRNSEFIEETVNALFIKAEARLMENRMLFVTGVRFEETRDKGYGPLVDPSAVYERNADGSFRRDANGLRIRRAEAGLSGSMEELRLTDLERAYIAKKSYHGYYPSLHFTYSLAENFLVRAAYARTYARPNFNQIIPNTTIDEADLGPVDGSTGLPGRINLRNSGLRPWSADNYDLSVEYYFPRGGLVSGGIFVKEIDDFFGTDVRLATQADLDALGLGSRYLGWEITTQVNSGAARIIGGEMNFRQTLAYWGNWGKYFSVFANATKLKLEGSRGADFSTFIPETLNWGITFSKRPLTLTARWNYRGPTKGALFPGLGPDAYTREQGRTTMDVNAEYQSIRGLSFFVNARNLFNVPWEFARYGSSSPDYVRAPYDVRYYGVQLNMGVKGRF